MSSGYYAACTGLMSRTQSLETIANNLANVSTAGFKATHNVFSSVLATASNRALDVVNQDANDYGVLTGTRLDTTQGALVHTGNDLDVAMEGPGYFVVQTANGDAYTRGGSFRVSTKNQLITPTGDPVLGDNNKPITIVGQPVSIATDGTITVNGAISGRLRMVEFAANVPVQSAMGGYFSVPAGATPARAANSQVRQGMQESSNVNPVTSVVELITAQREVETMRRVLTMFNSDMDKTAAQDLPHVG